MASRLASLHAHTFDLIVIGGGIVGAGIARDAALRGLSVALFEKNDYGSGTTSGSTRLIHGGLRYLEMLDFRLVRIDLREREILLRIAPHLVRPLEFLLPFYGRGAIYRLRMRIGLWLYDVLSFDKTLPSRRWLSRDEVIAREPALSTKGLQGAASYFDAQAPLPERLCLENIIDACQAATPARAFNYAEVTGALRDGDRVVGVRVRDRLNDEGEVASDGASRGDEVEVRARLVVNASGPWFDRVEGALTGSPSRRIRTTKGIHLAMPPVTNSALVLFSPLDDRLFFAIPWLGYTWVGTTDTDFVDDPSNARAEADDVDYLLRSAQTFLKDLHPDRLLFTNAGVRALVMEEGSESSVSRLHEISNEADARRRGLIEVMGGKLTGYRAIAEEAVDVACRVLQQSRPCVTATEPLAGARVRGGGTASDSGVGVSAETMAHLRARYGTRADDILRLIAEEPSLAEPLAPAYPDIAAQVVFAVREEHAVRLVDVLLRRTSLGFTPDQGQAAAFAAAAWMARELGWTSARRDEELARYQARIAVTQRFRAAD
jgi:glycerol-3-phosphate dehydrogenase